MAALVQTEQIEEVRRRTDIVTVIQARVPLRRSGADFVACCPFHRERTPSFHVNPSRQNYKCFGCGASGDVFAFLQKHDGMSFGDALRMLAERAGVELSFGADDGLGERRKRLLRLHAELADFYCQNLRESPAAASAREYLKRRALSDEVVASFRLGYAPATPGAVEEWARNRRFTPAELIEGGVLTALDRDGQTRLYDRFCGRLMFPIMDTQGRVVAFSGRLLEQRAHAAKYVNSAESPIFAKSRVLYALDKAQRAIVKAPGRQALVCEGQIDAIRCHAAGFGTAVASQGTAFTADHVQLLKRYADSAVLAFDSDSAGQKAAVSTARLFLAAGIAVRIARLPDGLDPDDFIRKAGPEAFGEVLRSAEEALSFQTRWLQSRESDPRSVEALGRISASLLETIQGCGNAVHQARLLQEAATLLDLPETALRTELERLAATAAQRAARHLPERGGVASAAERRRAAQAEAEAQILIDQDAAAVEIDGASADVPARAPRMPPEERSLCELLVHHAEDVALVRMLDEFLPLVLFRHAHARRVAGAVFASVRSGQDELPALQASGDAALLDFIGRLAVAPDRFGHGDFTLMDAARDLILAVWRGWLKGRRGRSAGQSDPAVADRERMQMAMELRALRSWESGRAVMVAARARLLDNPEGRDAPPSPDPAVAGATPDDGPLEPLDEPHAG